MPEAKEHLDSEIQKIESDVLPITKAAEAYMIVDQDTLEGGINFLGKVKASYDRVEQTRTFFTKPLLDLKRTYDAKFKPTLDELEQAEKSLKRKMVAYRETLVTEDVQPKTTKTQDAKATFVEMWVHKVVDPALVPDEYWKIDEAKIAKVVTAGMRNIPGVQITRTEEVRSSYAG